MSTDHDAGERRAADLARSLGPLVPGADVRARVLASVEATSQDEPAVSGRSWGLAAAAAAVLLGLMLWLTSQRTAVEPPEPSPHAAAARAPWDEPPEVAQQRAANEACYERIRELLRKEHRGKRIVIAHGEYHVVPDSGIVPEDAQSKAAHAFSFRNGDEGPREEFISEWYSPRFAGLALPAALGAEWSMQENTLKTADGKREQKGIGSVFPRFLFDLEGPPTRPGVPGPRLSAREVFLGTVGPPLMLTPEDAVALDLARWEIPGLVTIWKHVRCRQATVFVSVAGWDAPKAITALWPLTPRENLILWARQRDAFWSGAFVDAMLAETPTSTGKGSWILFGRDRVLGLANDPSDLLAVVERDTEATYHRYLLRWPREPELVLQEAELENTPRRVVLNDMPLAVRATSPNGPFLIDGATAVALRLERAEEGRTMWLQQTDGTRVQLLGGYAWLSREVRPGADPAPAVTRTAALVVHPFVPPPPPPPSPVPAPKTPR